MNIVEAFKSGKRIKRDTWDYFLTQSQVLNGGLLPDAITADDWEVEQEPITLTREDAVLVYNCIRAMQMRKEPWSLEDFLEYLGFK